jgi:3-phenylpropionate/trans-cinnamate dioxygenase ferredoxin reductase subunit
VAHVLVVGAGLAGARVCALLRAQGFSGRISLVGAEDEPPYDRPPLTKDPSAPVDLRAVMGLDVWEAADEVRLGARAGGLELGDGALRVEVDGAPVLADVVVVATGATPVLPSGWAGPGVHVLNTRADARALWAALGPGSDLVVVGGGWIGCEAAATAARRGARVALHEAAGSLLPGRVPAEVAERIAGWLAEEGVQVHLGSRVAGVTDVARDGRVVLVGMGVRPATDWLVGSGPALDASGAVLVDPWGRSSIPGVLAVGDVAARWSARAGRHLPGGHWTEALNAPEALVNVVVAWLAGEAAGRTPQAWRAEPGLPAADPIPYVFSDIAGRTLQVLGDTGVPGDVIWQESSAGWSAYLVDAAGGLLGACGTGQPRDIARARRAMMADPAGRPPARAVLAG